MLENKATGARFYTPMLFWCQIFAMVLAVLVSVRADAHALEQSYVFLNIGKESIRGRIEITIADLNRALPLSLSTDETVSRADIEPHISEIREYFMNKVSVTAPGLEPGLQLGEFELEILPLAQYLFFHFSIPGLSATPEYLDVDYRVLFEENPSHRAFLVIEDNWKTGTFDNEAVISLIFDPENTVQRLDLSSSTMANGFLAMSMLGVHHIWIGIDHILFLLALLLPSVVRRTDAGWEPAENFKSALIYVIKIVTLFTVAHTITLSAATLGTLSVPSRLVESVIAASIAIAALNILSPIFKSRIWLIVFIFGLFHGLGFASVLSTINIPPGYLAWSLLAFNVGVELGQIAIGCVAFPILYLLRGVPAYRHGGLQLGAVILIVVSLYWFVERGFAVDLPAGEYMNIVLQRVGLQA